MLRSLETARESEPGEHMKNRVKLLLPVGGVEQDRAEPGG